MYFKVVRKQTMNDEMSPTELITELLKSIEPGTPRHDALEGALEFKGSWVDMARRLKSVQDGELWEDWGYKTLNSYCRVELQLTRGEVRKLREGFEWLEEEAPELVISAAGDVEGQDRRTRPLPDLDTVDQLAKGYREVQQEKVPRDTYEELKRAALDGERSHYQLRREFKEAVPEHKRDKKPLDPQKHIRKAIKSFEKALEELEEMQLDGGEGDPKLTERARKLRDEMSQLLQEEEQAQE